MRRLDRQGLAQRRKEERNGISGPKAAEQQRPGAEHDKAGRHALWGRTCQSTQARSCPTSPAFASSFIQQGANEMAAIGRGSWLLVRETLVTSLLCRVIKLV
jgi:hypothetical protein